MRKLTGLILLALWSAPAGAQPIAFVDAHVIPMTEESVREGWTVLVEGDRIVRAGPTAEISLPDGTERIDARGKYLIPGLAEMHGHVPSAGDAYLEDILFLWVANGVTTVRGMLGSEGQLDLRRRANSGEMTSPSLYLAGPPFSGGSINSPEQASDQVRREAQEGWDFLKVLPGLTLEEYSAMAETARSEGIPMIGHVPSDVGLRRAIELGQQTIDHLDGFIEFLDGDKGVLKQDRVDEAVRLAVNHGVWIVPTMALWDVILGVPDLDAVTAFPELRYMPRPVVADWTAAMERRRAAAGFDQYRMDLIAENRIRLLKALNDGGAKILMGTDSPQQFSVPGFSLRREFGHMVAARMTPYEILATGTRNVGEYLAGKDDFGTIEAGKRADLILLNSNPLENVMRVFDRAGVMVQGMWHPEDEIRERLQAMAAAYRN